jgi:2-keto-4-pentenoate hydratase
MNDAVRRGLAAHLSRFDRALASGKSRLGWKVAFNVRAVQERLGLDGSLVAGLTRSTLLPGGTEHSLSGTTRPALEAEVAVWLGKDVGADDPEPRAAEAIASWAPAIELVDFTRSLDDVERILEEGVFHRAVVLGTAVAAPSGADLAGRTVRVDYAGEPSYEVDARVATGHAPAVLVHLARLLAPHGHGLRAGDVIILGTMNPFTVAAPPRTFSVAIDGLGTTSVSLVP